MLPARDHMNLFIGLALLFSASLLCYFFAALMGSATWGEVAGALGNIIGGMIGAGAAVLAVFLTLSRQRAEEMDKVSAAIRTEVTALAKHVIWSVGICRDVVQGTRTIPRTDTMYIVRNLMNPPTIYPAVADRVGLLPHPEATAAFYTRVSEVKAMADSYLRNTAPTAPATVTAEFATKIALGLVNALQCALPIVARLPRSNPGLANLVQNTTANEIAACLQMAQTVFTD